jgi:LacI family transcriptional regulator
MKPKDVLVLLNAPSSDSPIAALLDSAKRLGWRMTIEERLMPPEDWRGDGALVTTFDHPPLIRYLRRLRRRGVKVVDLADFQSAFRCNRCTFDFGAVSRMVAAHFRGLGFRRAAFFAMEPIPTRRLESAAFAKAWRGEFQSWVFDGSGAPSRWLRSRLAAAEKPLAVVCPNSYNAVRVLEECLAAGIRVPEEVSIVSEWYEPAFCENQRVAVSGVVCDTARRMREAVKLLDRLMEGDRSAPREILIPPDRLVVNESSDAYATGSPALRRVFAAIRRNLAHPIGVDELASVAGVSRTTLDRLFAAELGRSVGSEILRQRLLKAKRLLETTDMKLATIAAECGFCHSSYFVKAFSAAEGTTPGAWRQRH